METQESTGVSATHLDWTMVPYVKKSFYKHFKDGVKYISNLGFEDFENGFIKDHLSINANIYKNKPYQEAYKYAMDMTQKELEQAVEGMYHNLK